MNVNDRAKFVNDLRDAAVEHEGLQTLHTALSEVVKDNMAKLTERKAPCKHHCEAVAFKKTIKKLEKKLNL